MRAATSTASHKKIVAAEQLVIFVRNRLSREDFERFKALVQPKEVAADFLPLLIEGAEALGAGAEAGGLAAGAGALAEGAELGAGALAEMAGGGEAAGGAAEAGLSEGAEAASGAAEGAEAGEGLSTGGEGGGAGEGGGGGFSEGGGGGAGEGGGGSRASGSSPSGSRTSEGQGNRLRQQSSSSSSNQKKDDDQNDVKAASSGGGGSSSSPTPRSPYRASSGSSGGSSSSGTPRGQRMSSAQPKSTTPKVRSSIATSSGSPRQTRVAQDERQREKLATAVHEAGHAAVAIRSGGTARVILRIAHDGELSASTYEAPGPRHTWRCQPEFRRALVNVAGEIAEEKFFGSSPDRWCVASDRANLALYAEALGLDENALRRDVHRRVKSEFDNNPSLWQGVLALAGALFAAWPDDSTTEIEVNDKTLRAIVPWVVPA